MNALVRIQAVLIKELKQLKRDRLSFALIAGFPIIELLMFGYAINTDVRNIDIAVADQAGSSLSRELVADVARTQVVHIAASVATPGELEAGLKRGEWSAGLYLPHDFERRLARGGEPAAQLLIDGSDPTVFGVLRQLADMPFGLETAGQPATRDPVFALRAFFNPERRSQLNIVPGLLGLILTMTMVMFTAVAIVRERELGNLEFLINTPVRNAELMIGKLLPYVFIGLIQVSILVALGALIFDVPGARRNRRAVSCLAAVHCRQPGTRARHLDGNAIAVPGDAAQRLRAAAVRAAVGLHVSVRRYATRGAVDRRGPADDALHSPDPGNHVA